MAFTKEYLTLVPEWAVNLFTFFSVFLENIFPPWPSDVLLVFTGFLAAHNNFNPYLLILSSVLGNTAGAIVMYYSGLRLLHWLKRRDEKGGSRMTRNLFHFAASEEMERAGMLFRKYGLVFVAASRFFPGIRFFVSIIAGASSFPVIRFLAAFLLGVTLWNYLLITGGFMLGDRWDKIIEILDTYGKISGVISAVLLTLAALWLYRKRWMKIFAKQQKS